MEKISKLSLVFSPSEVEAFKEEDRLHPFARARVVDFRVRGKIEVSNIEPAPRGVSYGRTVELPDGRYGVVRPKVSIEFEFPVLCSVKEERISFPVERISPLGTSLLVEKKVRVPPLRTAKYPTLFCRPAVGRELISEEVRFVRTRPLPREEF